MEPPRADLPARRRLTAAGPDAGPALRRALAAAALVLAATSTGELLVLAALLAPDVRRWRALPQVLGLAAAVVASSARWGTTSLEALAGVQAVLGPAGGIGPAWGAAASWLAAGAVLLAGASRAEPVRAAATGATVAALLAGPAVGGEVVVRVATALGAAAAALVLARWRSDRRGADAALAGLAGALGLAAVGAVLAAGVVAGPELEGGLVLEGAAVAAASAGAWLVGERAVARAVLPRWRGHRGSPSVVEPSHALR